MGIVPQGFQSDAAYEGWTDNTDPGGAFGGFGNFYSLLLPYQFFYNSDGTHNFQTDGGDLDRGPAPRRHQRQPMDQHP